jgi:hypothetical protein
MEEKFLTIDELAEVLKDRGYDYRITQAWVAAGRCPYEIRNMVMVVPWPRADKCFPQLFTDEDMKAMGAVIIPTDGSHKEIKIEKEN